MKGLVSNAKFQELFNRFQNEYSNSGNPVVVMYFRENKIIKIYMNVHNFCWYTRIGVEDGAKFLSIFTNPVEILNSL